MATTARLGITLLEVGQASKEVLIDNALNTLDASAALQGVANTFTQANVFSGSLRHTGTQAGFFGAALVNQPATNVDLRTALVNLGLIAGGANPLNTNGGSIICNALAMSGAISGSGTAFSLKRFSLTFPTDADYTLAAGELDAVVIDVAAGVITATRNIIVPTTGSALYVVINRNAQSVVLKTAGGTGITVATTRTRIIYLPTGVNAFALTAAQDYTV